MSPDRAAWLLAHPLDYASSDPAALADWRTREPQPDGAILTAILAVDR